MKNEAKNSEQVNHDKQSESSHNLKSAVANELKNFLADIEDLVKQSASLSGTELNLAKQKITQYIDSAKASVEHLGGDIARKAEHSAKVTDDYVHAQPWQAIGAGAAVGLVLGFLLARK